MTTARFPENMIAVSTRGERPRWRVKAWREPSPAMQKAFYDSALGLLNSEDTYEVVIDAALKEGT